ncbi:hypothetical protein CK203_050518 [Vitis vinifera]|uniref:Reverse transcriptase zinc-binding domain-containing protein n=1 Tax=Vitis vinifera TaxID=29760 RepID=A0A438GX28_VITVI|nr:hypothetical protein CK203_050518 [Vitis vinifera]
MGCVENVEALATKLGCKVGSLPSSYLGLPLGASFKFVAAWDGVEKRFRKRLAMWKIQYISKEGRLTLIQNKRKGGLGVKCLSSLNKALSCKWSWRFANERGALWNQVIRGKYGEEQGGWCSKEVKGGYGVGLWKAIRREWHIPKVSFFGWEATWGKALTLDQLQKRGWPLANKCYLFQMHEESIDHILLHCAKTRTLWALFFTLFGVQWVLPASVKMTLLGWNRSFVGKERKEVWRADPLRIFWTVGKVKEQNCV